MSGLLRKLSNRGKKGAGNESSQQSVASSSRGAAMLSPQTASGGSSSREGGLFSEKTNSYGSSPAGHDTAQPEDEYDMLRDYDTVFLIDDSGSMNKEEKNGLTRWEQTREVLKHITPEVTQRDADGIDIYFLNMPDRSRFKGITRPNEVTQIMHFIPSRETPTGERLEVILKPYIEECEKKHRKNVDLPKKLNVIVITDGAPQDKTKVETVLIDIGRRLDRIEAYPVQLGVQFIQVGEDKAAEKWLKSLDDELHGKKKMRDFVDTVSYTDLAGRGFDAQAVMKALMGAIKKRVDRMNLKN